MSACGGCGSTADFCSPDCPAPEFPTEPTPDLPLDSKGLLDRADSLTGCDTGDLELAGWLDAIEEAVYRTGASIVAALEKQTEATEALTRATSRGRPANRG